MHVASIVTCTSVLKTCHLIVNANTEMHVLRYASKSLQFRVYQHFLLRRSFRVNYFQVICNLTHVHTPSDVTTGMVSMQLVFTSNLSRPRARKITDGYKRVWPCFNSIGRNMSGRRTYACTQCSYLDDNSARKVGLACVVS